MSSRHEAFPFAIRAAQPEFALILKLFTLNHASMVIAELKACRTGESTIVTLFCPLKAKPWPTSAGAYAAVPFQTPLFVPMLSLGLPSPRHQPTMPDGGAVQLAKPAHGTAKSAANKNKRHPF